MTSEKGSFIGVALAGLLQLACGGATPAAPATVEDEPPPPAPAGDDDPRIEGLLGTIPVHEVERVFERNHRRLADCYGLALDAADEIGGRLEFALSVLTGGEVGAAFLRYSDLGSVEVEECMVHAVTGMRFPSPRGGGRAEVSYSMTVDAPAGGPPVVAWDESRLAAAVEEHRDEVERCLGGAAGVLLTVYVGPGGRVLSAGGSGDDIAAADAARCLARAAMDWSLPDPGRDTAKVSMGF